MPDCFDKFKNDLKGEFSDGDIDLAIKSTKDAIARAQKEGANISERLNKHADQLKEQHKFAEAQREFMWWRQQELINKIVNLISNFRGRKNVILKALTSYIDGTEFGVEGARDSFSLRKHVLHNIILSKLFTKMKKAGVLPLWNSKQFQEEFVHALETGESSDENIRKLGNAVNELKDFIKKTDQSNGIFFHNLEGRFFKNFHSKKLLKYTADKLRDRIKNRNIPISEQRKMSFDRWKEYVKPRVDVQRSFGDHLSLTNNEGEIDNILSGIYDQLIDQKEFKGIGDDIVSMSRKQRVLIWNDAKAAVEYNEKFGTGHTSTAIEAEMEGAAQRNASLERFGDKPLQTLQAAVLRAEKIFPDLKGDFDKSSDFNKIKRLYLEARGVTTDPNSNIAKISSSLKTFNNYTKLGRSFFRILTDLAPTTVDNKRLHGSFLNSMKNTIADTIKGMSAKEREKFGSLLDSVTAGNLGGNARTFMDSGATVGSMSRMQRLYFKFSLHTPWDVGVKSGKAISEARHLAFNRHLSFDDIAAKDTDAQKLISKIGGLPQGEATVNVAKQYNIKSSDWDAIRSAPTKLVDNEHYIFPESAQEISDSKILEALKSDGISEFTSEGQKNNLIQRKKDEIQNKFEAYTEDRIDHSIFRPGALDRLRLFFHTESGTASRHMMSLLNQFRMYGLTWVTKGIAPKIYGKGADSFWEAMFKGKADYLGLVQMMAYSWVLRYAGMAGAALTIGESIPDPFDPETIKRSAFEGLGLYADAISATAQNRELGTYRDLAGTNIEELVDTSRQLYNATFGKFSGIQAANYLEQNTPAANLWFLKYAVDYAFFNRLKEAISPGYFEKKKRELEKHGQHYIMPPV